jgi:hypothetical protein
VPTAVQRLLPRMVVVPPESAYPGFGDFVMLSDMDHIQVAVSTSPVVRQFPTSINTRRGTS